MLTNLYYFDHYRPYIIKSENTQAKARPNFRKQNEQSTANTGLETPAAEVSLNKALNKNVISYAQGIYKNTTELKDTSKKISTNLRNLSKYKDNEEFDKEAFEKRFKGDLEKFAGSYNRSIKFLKSQQHSPYLGETAQRLDKITDNSEKLLDAMGITKDSSGEMLVNPEKKLFTGEQSFQNESQEADKLFKDIYKEASGMLNAPMSKHMNFKSLNYYYNYEVDKVKVDSFQIIKTGLLVNLAL